MLWPERPHRTARRCNFRFARCRARGSASIAKYFLVCPEVKFNNINLPLLTEAERWLHLEHLECGQQPHAQDRGAEKRTQLAGRSGSGYGLESPDP